MLSKLKNNFIKNNYSWLEKIQPTIGVGNHILRGLKHQRIQPNMGVGDWSIRGSKKISNEFTNVDSLIESHFQKNSSPNHICRPTLNKALEMLGTKPSVIVETGSSAWGSNSSLLFDSYVQNFGGKFESVDIRIEPSITLSEKVSNRTILHCDDSVNFLSKWKGRNGVDKIDLLYLDSWDVNWSDPNPSGLHGLAEFLAASSSLQSGSILLVDDTPLDEVNFVSAQSDLFSFTEFKKKNGFFPGKGSLIKEVLKSLGRGREVMHKYQLLWLF